jgi:hypothetical protein
MATAAAAQRQIYLPGQPGDTSPLGGEPKDTFDALTDTWRSAGWRLPEGSEEPSVVR